MGNIFLILNYCTPELTLDLAKKVVEFQLVDIVVIVDNKSPDDSYEFLTDKLHECDNVHVIQMKKNGGYSYGNNAGLKFIMDKYNPDTITIANPDIDIEEKDFDIILTDLKKYPSLAIQTGTILNIYEKKVSNQLWWCPKYEDMILNQLPITYKIRRLLGKSNYSNFGKLADNIIYAEAVPGCFFVLKTSLLKKMELFDDEFFLYSEENVISYKLKSISMYAGVSSNAIVRHNHVYKSEKGRFVKNRKLLLKSYCKYLNKYLQVYDYQIVIFKIVFWIGEIERKFIEVIKRSIDHKNARNYEFIYTKIEKNDDAETMEKEKSS